MRGKRGELTPSFRLLKNAPLFELYFGGFAGRKGTADFSTPLLTKSRAAPVEMTIREWTCGAAEAAPFQNNDFFSNL
jgi:hypothetical protein